MRNIVSATALILLAANLVAADTPPAVNVGLTANPASQIPKGSAVTLTATVTPKKPQSDIQRKNLLPAARLRYSFTAQRSWPCSDPVQDLAKNVENAVLTTTPSKGGIYTFGVDVKWVNARLGVAPPLLKGSDDLGKASVANYSVTPGSFPYNTPFTYSPASGTATGPVSVTASVSLNPPPDPGLPHRFIYTWSCQAGNCGGQTCKHDVAWGTDSCTFNNLAKGAYQFTVRIDEIDPSTCDWKAYRFAGHDYVWYYVN